MSEACFKLESTPDLLNKLFIHGVRQLPLTAELFRYVRTDMIYTLESRCRIARTHGGTVYLGVREIPTQHDVEGSAFAIVVVWDAANGTFIIRDCRTDAESATSGVLLNGFQAIAGDYTRPAQQHLGYPVYFVGNSKLRYCPALEIAMTDEKEVQGREYHDIIRWIERGEPDVHEFEI